MNWFLLSLPLFVCLFTHKISSKQYLNLTLCVQALVDHTDQRAEAIPCSTATPNWTVHVSDVSFFFFFLDSSIGLHCNCNIPNQESMLGFQWDSDRFFAWHKQ